MKRRILILIAGCLIVGANVSAEMYLDGNGNVGIGTASPSVKLDVNGTIKANFFEGDGSRLSGVITSETDPTVPDNIKDGVSWSEISNRPNGLDNGDDIGVAYAGYTVVAKSGGDYSDPLTAMSDIGDWCGTPSAANPCLLKIMPGEYYISDGTLQMLDYVDIEGSGESITKLKGNRGNHPGVLAGSNNAELRFISVENTGGGSFAYAVTNLNTSLKITNVTAIASGANEQVSFDCESNCSSVMTNVTAIASGGTVAIGFYLNDSVSPTIINANVSASGGTLSIGFNMDNNSSPIMSNVTIIASGVETSHALHIKNESSPVISNVTATALDATNDNFAVYIISASWPVITNIIADASGGENNYGVFNKTYSISGGTIRIDHSTIKGTTGSIYVDSTFTTLVGNSLIEGSVTGPGIITCVGAYNEYYASLNNSCQLPLP
jgi:hypothetical protein